MNTAPSSTARFFAGFLLTVCLPFVLAVNAAAQLPERMAFQGYLVDANGTPLGGAAPANYEVQFRIYNAETGGTLLWQEQQTITADAGHFSVLLGEGTQVGSAPKPNLSEVFRGANLGVRWVEIAVAFTAGGAFNTVLPRLRLLSSPYAFTSTQALSFVSPQGNLLATGDGSTISFQGSIANTLSFGARQGQHINLWSDRFAIGIQAATLYFRVNANSHFAWHMGGDHDEGVLNPGSGGVMQMSLNSSGNLWVRGSVTANGGIAGSGAGLTGLNANNITSGTLSDARLSGNVASRTAANTFSGTNTFNNTVSLGGSSTLNFGARLGQHINLWSNTFGLGIQESTLYFRSSDRFAWHRGGSHADGALDSGGGTRVMSLDSGGSLSVNANVNAGGSVNAGGNVNAGGSYFGGGGFVMTNATFGGELRMREPNGNYGFFWYKAGSGAVAGGGREIVVGASGNSFQMSGGRNWVAFNGGFGWFTPSDEGVKTNITDAEPLLDQVMAIRLRRFNYRNDESQAINLGVIAQETEGLFPHLVTETSSPDGNTIKAVTYSGFGILAVGALQELADRQAAENAELRERIEQLEAIVNALVGTGAP